MHLILPAIIQIILDILLTIFLPSIKLYDSQYYEQIIKNHCNINIDLYDNIHTCYYENNYLIEEFLDELNPFYSLHLVLLILAIILVSISLLLLIVSIVYKCKEESSKCFIYFLIIMCFIIIFTNLVLSLIILAKMNKARTNGEIVGIFDTIKSIIVKTTLIIASQLLFAIFQIVMACAKFKSKKNESNENHRSHQIYTPKSTRVNNYVNTDTNPTTTRVINVRRETNMISSLRSIVSNEVYSNLNTYISTGKLLFIDYIKFYKEMKFDGLTSYEEIKKETFGIVMGLCDLLKEEGNQISETLIRLMLLNDTKDLSYFYLLILYLYPLIFLVIKLKINEGIYKRSYPIVITNVLTVLEQLESHFERDINGNIRQTFRYTRQINKATLLRCIKG